MPHVQRPGDIRRRNHNSEGFAFAAGLKIAGSFPTLIPGLFNAVGLIGFIHGLQYARIGLVNRKSGLYRYWRLNSEEVGVALRNFVASEGVALVLVKTPTFAATNTYLFVACDELGNAQKTAEKARGLWR